MNALSGQSRTPLVLVGFAITMVACSSSPSGSDAFETRLISATRNLIEDYDLPGMTVAIAGPDGVMSVAAGDADPDNGRAMTSETTMLAASIGKTFVAATVLQMSDEGKLKLDDPISDWLGDKDWFDRLPNASGITIRHLLQHRAGLQDHVHMQAFSDLWLGGREDLAPEDLIALVLDTEPLFPAGEAWSYSDTGYLMLGLIVEKVAGRSYEDEIRERFLNPLGLTSTGPSNQKRLPQLASGYASGEPGLGLAVKTTDDSGAMVWNPAIEWTGGGLYSTSYDLALWGRYFLSGRLLTESTYQQALGGVAASDGDANSLYGLGISIRLDSPWGPVYGHRGWIPGYVSSLQYYPEYDTAIAFQTNTDIGIIDAPEPIIFRIEETIATVVLSDIAKDMAKDDNRQRPRGG